MIELESRPEHRSLISRWSRAEHESVLAQSDRKHWIIERDPDGQRLGYLIAFDLRAHGFGIYLKRISVTETSIGVGRSALRLFLAHAFGELGAESMFLDVYAHNQRARRAYLAVGFSEVDASDFDRSAPSALVGESTDAIMVMRASRDGRTRTREG